jgi:hypothetical protein
MVKDRVLKLMTTKPCEKCPGTMVVKTNKDDTKSSICMSCGYLVLNVKCIK